MIFYTPIAGYSTRAGTDLVSEREHLVRSPAVEQQDLAPLQGNKISREIDDQILVRNLHSRDVLH